MNRAAAPGPSAEDVPDPFIDDACEDWAENPSAFRVFEVGCQDNVLLGTSRKSQTAFKGRSRGMLTSLLLVFFLFYIYCSCLCTSTAKL